MTCFYIKDILWIRVIRVRGCYNRDYRIQFRDKQGEVSTLIYFRKKSVDKLIEKILKDHPGVFAGEDDALLHKWYKDKQATINELIRRKS